VTHSAELVERFQEMEKGQYLQVEFDGGKPTHRLIEGISTESHAYRVARKIGFASEDIERYLKEKGYIS
jgi:dsDNA-specific endonuclease/ATPase MutS2